MSNRTQQKTTDDRRIARTERTSKPIVEISSGTVTFDMERGTSRVLDNVDLAVERGEVLGIVGESGSGKSMLASAFLDAVVDPGRLSGEITYHPKDGDPISILDLPKSELKSLRWNEISMVFQGAMSSFNPTMKIREHFELVLDAHGADRENGLRRTRDLLTGLYLDPDRVLNSYPHELSGGMSQRALIALSVVLEPDVLVMDEPTAALDLLMQRSILSLLTDLKEQYDLTIVFITHDLPLVTKIADRIGVMYAFDLVEVGPTERIVTDAAHPYTRALIRSTPTINASLSDMEIVGGSSPDPVNIPTGCAYHPRCPLSDDQCVSEDPQLRTLHNTGANHSAACHHWEDATEAVEFDIENYMKQNMSDEIDDMRAAIKERQ